MNHAEASELLGAYALDAVDADEAAAIEAHVETCPRCRDELRSHREVVGVLAYAGQEAPEGLWDRVVARINDPGESQAATTGHSLRLVRVEAGPDAAAPASPARARAAARWSRGLAVVAAAAVVVVALLGVEVVRLQDRTSHLSNQIAAMSGQPSLADVRHALATPGARVVALRPPAGGGVVLDAVLLPGGDGYLYDAHMTPLSAAETYQLWGVVGTQRISYGIMGPTPPAVMAFRASAGVQALAVTEEVAGGVVVSTQRPVAVGLLD